jgi:heat shock protein HslJ
MIANKLKKIEYLKFPSLEGRRGGSINKNIQFFEFHRLYGQTLISKKWLNKFLMQFMKTNLSQFLIRFVGTLLIAGTVSCTSILYVAPKKADCTGAGAQTCYLIRKGAEGNWILHYEDIKGLDYEPGFSYRIKVKKETVKNVPADRASFQYSVVEVLEKRDVTDDLVSEDLLDKEWKLEYMKFEGTQYGMEEIIPTLNFLDDGKVNGFAGCNTYFGNYDIDGRTITFAAIGATRMHCEAAMELEQAFLKLLSGELRGLFNDSKLILSGDAGNQMIFGYK